MSRTEAQRKRASAFRSKYLQSLTKRRQRFSQALVRSMIQRFGQGHKFAAAAAPHNLAIHRIADPRQSTTELRSASAWRLSRNGYIPNGVATSSTPPSQS